MHEELKQAVALDPKFRSHLRLVDITDAEFITRLRSDPSLSQHLQRTEPGVETQRAWIARYKLRERAGSEFYFVIVCDGIDRGVIRMYDFLDQRSRHSFCWGSWIIAPPRPLGLAIYSALLIYEIGFEVLGFDQSHFDVRKENTSVNAFHIRSGAMKTGEDDENNYYVFERASYEAFKAASQRQIRMHRLLCE